MDHNYFFKSLLLVAFLACSFGMKASGADHNGSLEGRVFDAVTQEALPGTRVRLLNSKMGAASNPLGTFKFGELEAGKWQVELRFLGYQTDTFEVVVRENETAWLEAGMQPAPVEIKAVDIRSGAWADPGRLAFIDAQLRPVLSGQDLLQATPGLFIAQHGGGGKAEQIFLRGFDLDHGTDIALDVDGVPVNMVSHAHGQGYADLHFLIPETVERNKISKGPYQSDQGNLATAGAVSFQTKSSLQGSSLQLESGSFGRFRALAMVDLTDTKTEAKGKSGYLAGEFMGQRGFFEMPQDLRRLNLFGKYRLAIGKSNNLEISGQTFKSSWRQSGQIPVRAVESGDITRFGALDSTEGGSTSRSGVNLRLNTVLPSGGVVQQQLYGSLYSFDLTSNFTFFLNDSLNGDAIRQRENRFLYGYRATHLEQLSLFGRTLQHKAGVSLRMDEVRDLGLDRVYQRETVVETVKRGEVDELNAGIFIEESLALTDRLTATAGLRYDRFQFRYKDALADRFSVEGRQQGILSPKLRLDYALTERVRLYLYAGSGFHSNDSRIVVRDLAEASLPRAVGADFGVIAKPLERMLLQAAVWGLDMEQEFVYVGDEGVVEPSGQSRRIGLDLSLRYQISNWIFVDGDLNLSRPRASGGAFTERIPLAPTFTSAGGVSVETPFGLSGSFRYRYLAERPANEDWTLSAEGFSLFDAHVFYSLSERIQFGVSCTNLLNQDWKEAQFETESRLQGEVEPVSEIHFTPGSPRAWNFKLKFNF